MPINENFVTVIDLSNLRVVLTPTHTLTIWNILYEKFCNRKKSKNFSVSGQQFNVLTKENTQRRGLIRPFLSLLEFIPSRQNRQQNSL